jgi:hypothetical protein
VEHRPEFTIGTWEQDATVPDDGLRVNPCWPSAIAPADPGFALLTYDPFYQGQAPPYNYAAAYVSGKNGVKRGLDDEGLEDDGFNSTMAG